MAYVNVAEWSVDQVADWIKGLEGVSSEYVQLFLSGDVNGQRLLNLRAEDLDNVGVVKIGHQELILEAVSQLRNFHYELDKENLQHLALKLSCAATSLFKELIYHQNGSKVETQSLSDVTNVISAVKPLASWLDRPPFNSHPEYTDKKTELLKLSFVMATSAQRDRFAENPLMAIRDNCRKLSNLADSIIQDILDPMLLQPATLELATYKKREQDDLKIILNRNGIHEVLNSIGKIEQGDGIVQVNYQTVVGWTTREVTLLCEESPSEVVLTLKKRPRHTHTYGQIYIKPYRLPSRKRSTPYTRWGTLPSPRPELLVIKNFEIPLPRCAPVPISQPELDLQTMSSSDDESELSSTPGSPSFDTMSAQSRIFLPKPRSVVQRRNTTSGSSPVSKRPYISIEQFRRELKNHTYIRHTGSAQMATSNHPDDISDNLCRRDKSVSCSTGLELSPRPNTCLGVDLNHSKIIKLNKQKLKFTEEKTSSKTVKFDDSHKTGKHENNRDEKERGRLDKSHSTPAYDFGEENDSEYPLMEEIIPESPAPTENPAVIVHSPEKIDQILMFKKSSEEILSAMNSHKGSKNSNSKCTHENSKNPNIFGEKLSTDNDSNDTAKILETINIALLEHKEKEDFTTRKILNNENIFQKEFGKSSSDVDISLNIQTIQNELLEGLNKKLLISENKLDVPPEPPPRPASTQRPGYVLSRPHKPIQKEDIQVIPNTDVPHPGLPIRKDIQLPLNSAIHTSPINSYQTKLASESKLSINSTSNSEAPAPRTPMMPSRSLQVLEPEQMYTSSSFKLDASPYYVKSGDDKLSVSPANSMVRGLLYVGKSRSLKKKHSILAKRREVTVDELGPSDVEGFLYQRCRSKKRGTDWQLKWFILIDNIFYGFKSKDSQKADCMIFLKGFTVTVAKEVKSRPFAFKVYHTGTAFYFASESEEIMTSWVDFMSKATLNNSDSWERAHKSFTNVDESRHFSETDYSDEESKSTNDDNMNESKSSSVLNGAEDKEVNVPLAIIKTSEKFKSEKEKPSRFNSLKKMLNSKGNQTSSGLEVKFRFFSMPSKSKEEKSKAKYKDGPVKTENTRTYVPVKMSNSSSMNNTLTVPNSMTSVLQGDSSEKNSKNVAKITKLDPISNTDITNDVLSDLGKYQKKDVDPMNYIHASYPNLLDFDKSDFAAKPISPSLKTVPPRPDNLIGFVTLEEFMLKKQEEERKQLYSNRVLLGVERDVRNGETNNSIAHKKSQYTLQQQWDRIVPDVIYGEIPTYIEHSSIVKNNVTPAKVEQIQNRSLPKAPANSIKPVESTSSESMKSTKYSFKSKKKNDGYETIKYDEEEEMVKKQGQEFSISIPPKGSRKLFSSGKDAPEKTPLLSAQDDIRHTKDATNIYGEEQPVILNYIAKTKTGKKDFGYETIYGDTPLQSSKSSQEEKLVLQKPSLENKKPVPPPKLIGKPSIHSVKPSLNVSRQSSFNSTGDRKSSGVDTKAVFKQGDSPEKFWLDSLRRNDKVYSSKSFENNATRVDKFYTKHSEPSAYLKSSEATIVKSDKMYSKVMSSSTVVESQKSLKSVTQYKPLSIPMSPNRALKTSPQFELSLDTRETTQSSSSGISRIRNIFQHSSNTSSTKPLLPPANNISKEKTILGSPRLHRAIFRKHHNTSAPDEWAQEFSFVKVPPPVETADELMTSDVFPTSASDSSLGGVSNLVSPDYSHLPLPPTFVPEKYSLADLERSAMRKNNQESQN